jgi:hypothetical protein
VKQGCGKPPPNSSTRHSEGNHHALGRHVGALPWTRGIRLGRCVPPAVTVGC